ncbi:MAG: type transport system ATP-binding protein [Actinomycetota bacterium]|jgi:ABC-2 type transport system ATP-binding protein|nr:type transport system ATP-binding protein [Actinomycetota bacterium]
MANAIVIEGLHKTYRRLRGRPTVAIDGLSLEIEEGGVFGLLGPNGSGKTTTIRCLLGLVRPSAGRISVLGRPVPDGLAETLRSVGAVVESAAFLPAMTGREQIRLLAAIDGIPDRAADDALEAIGLAERAGDAVRTYSLGMRQRLALAAAILKDPALLVLDEPANGLDPAGMRDIRLLVRRLASEGRTVLLSSHLLSEVEQTCDRVAIVSRGRCLTAATVADVLAGAHPASLVRVVETDRDRAATLLGGIGALVEPAGDLLRVRGLQGQEIAATLGQAGLWPSELRPEERHLEDLFLELTA